MKVALIQTKQNVLYNFADTGRRFSVRESAALRDEMVEQTLRLGEDDAGQGCDLIVTTEAVNFCGTPDSIVGDYASLFPEFPSDPLFDRLSRLARKTGAWLVAGVYNRRGGKLYNSAAVWDRSGRFVDIYDKIHLAGSENDALTPGKRIVTVDTDMGRMGLAVCYDMQFPDVCARCRQAGAEFMAVPTWGWEHGYGLRRVRETGLRLAVAMAVPYWMPITGERFPSELVDPDGSVLACAGRTIPQLLIGEM